MHLYAIYDRDTGEVVQTHAKYVLGDDQPVACTDEEVLAAAEPEMAQDRRLGVAHVPEGFDPRDRTTRVTVDPDTGEVQAATRKPPRPASGSA